MINGLGKLEPAMSGGRIIKASPTKVFLAIP
jgi:hypothetical protein